MKGNLPRLSELVRRGVPLPFGCVKSRRSMLYVGNLATAIETCLGHPRASGQVFHVADDGALTARELVSEIATLLGVRARVVPVPVSFLRFAGVLLRRGDDVRRVTEPLLVSHTKLTDVLGWRPSRSVHEGLARSIGQGERDGTAP
jgi:UDP-glucose 4-epimerase